MVVPGSARSFCASLFARKGIALYTAAAPRPIAARRSRLRRLMAAAAPVWFAEACRSCRCAVLYSGVLVNMFVSPFLEDVAGSRSTA